MMRNEKFPGGADQAETNETESEKDSLEVTLKKLSEKRIEQLNALLEKSPELQEKIKEALEKTIDIEKYQGLIHHSHPGNLGGIFKLGLGSPEANIKFSFHGQYKWNGSGPIVYQEGVTKTEKGEWDQRLSVVYFTTYSKANSFHDWSLNWWSELNPLTLLVDGSKMDHITKYFYLGGFVCAPYEISINGDDRAKFEHLARETGLNFSGRTSLLSKASDEVLPLSKAVELLQEVREESCFEIKISSTPEIRQALKSAVIGVVVPPNEAEIVWQCKEKYNPETKSKENKDRKVKFSPDQIADVTMSRMSRVLMEEGSTVSPLYDNLGNMLWPKYMTHDEVMEFIAERDKEKESKK